MAKKLGLELQASSGPITGATLEGARLLYLRAPSGEFTDTEAVAIAIHRAEVTRLPNKN
jgi:hypothetical protein